MKKYCLCFILVFVVGCVSGSPTKQQSAEADYGTPIGQEEAQLEVVAWLKSHLKDPSSANIEWGEVGKGWARSSPITGGKLFFGYRLETKVNAKNSFGGYIGYRNYVFMFKNGGFQAIWGEQSLGSGYSSTYMARLL